MGYNWIESIYEISLGESVINNETSGEVEFVNLGLPSGTLWTRNQAGSAESNIMENVEESEFSLPTYDQAAELIEECDFLPIDSPNGGKIMVVRGPNGNAIRFPMNEYEDLPSPAAVSWCQGGPGAFRYIMILSETNITIGVSTAGRERPFHLVSSN